MTIDIEELTRRKTSESFPNIVINNLNVTLPVIIQSLEKGDMQLIIEHNGIRKVPIRISESAINIDRLIRGCGKITYVKNESESYEINSVLDYLQCVCE